MLPLSGVPPPSTEPTDSKSALKVSVAEIISLLQISPAVTTRPKVVDLRLAYSKYTAYLRANSEMLRMINDSTWPYPEKLPTDDLVEVFVSRSVFHASYQKLFSRAQEHPQILAWLLNDHDSPSSYDIFGVQKSVYTFRDLKRVLDSADGGGSSSKGKRKASDEDGGKERKKLKKSGSSKHRYSSP
jgi:hypothetical protein